MYNNQRLDTCSKFIAMPHGLSFLEPMNDRPNSIAGRLIAIINLKQPHDLVIKLKMIW